jgi:hypothetical protein
MPYVIIPYFYFQSSLTGIHENKLLEYVRKYNPDGTANIQAYHMLRPIPQSQLDAVSNKGEFTQNEGYN